MAVDFERPNSHFEELVVALVPVEKVPAEPVELVLASKAFVAEMVSKQVLGNVGHARVGANGYFLLRVLA